MTRALARSAAWIGVASCLAAAATAFVVHLEERRFVEPGAPFRGSDYVTVRGFPFFFVAEDATVERHPPLSLLVKHFLADWLVWFIVLGSIFGILWCVWMWLRELRPLLFWRR